MRLVPVFRAVKDVLQAYAYDGLGVSSVANPDIRSRVPTLLGIMFLDMMRDDYVGITLGNDIGEGWCIRNVSLMTAPR
jgi:hypothetical protein